ncbi:MAG: type II toxin-antitoxin system HicB family antitoxin [Patescibacteria group bacterium]
MTYMCTTVITQEGKWFVAHCVELGVVSQGKNVEEAQRNLKEAVGLYEMS